MMLLLALMLAQDAEGRYREALYLEVDKGDLEKAIELYRKVEADGGAAESLRAKSAFRLAWCLEKKGQKVDAERGYREVATKYAGQSDVVAKARERLDRLVSGNGGAAPVSMSDRIAGLILELGGKEPEEAMRTLVLMGEPAIPALRQALTHKDPTLSGMAACALVDLEQDSGTYAALERGLRQGASKYSNWYTYSHRLSKLVRRQEGYRKDFIEAFKKVEDRWTLERYLQVVDVNLMGDLRDRLKDLLCVGPVDCGRDIAYKIDVSRAEEVSSLFQRLEKSTDREKRTNFLLGRLFSEGEQSGPRLLCSLLLGELSEIVRGQLLSYLVAVCDRLGDREVSEAALWKASEEPRWRTVAAQGLVKLIPESHPRWDEVMKLRIPILSDVDKFLAPYGAESRVRIGRIAAKLAAEGSPEEREKAIYVLDEVGDESRFEVFSKVALDVNLKHDLRCLAIDRLKGEFARVRPSFEKLVKDKDDDVRVKTVLVLLRQWKGEADDLLAPLVQDEYFWVRHHVVGYFAEAPREGFLDPLIKALQDSEAGFRLIATRALGATESMKAVPYLIERLRDDDPGVRAAARAALEAIKKHAEEVEQWKKWYEGVRGEKK